MLNRLRAVFSCLNSLDVRYVVIGGVAAVLHGVPRSTFDLDLLIEATPENAERQLKAQRQAGLGTADLVDASRLLAHEITVFNDRIRIDVMTSKPGLDFKDAWERRDTMVHGGQPFFVACLQDVLASKRAAGRPQDLDDVRVLELRRRP